MPLLESGNPAFRVLGAHREMAILRAKHVEGGLYLQLCGRRPHRSEIDRFGRVRIHMTMVGEDRKHRAVQKVSGGQVVDDSIDFLVQVLFEIGSSGLNAVGVHVVIEPREIDDRQVEGAFLPGGARHANGRVVQREGLFTRTF